MRARSVKLMVLTAVGRLAHASSLYSQLRRDVMPAPHVSRTPAAVVDDWYYPGSLVERVISRKDCARTAQTAVLKGCRCWLAQTATTGRGASLARFESICDRGRTFGASPDVVY